MEEDANYDLNSLLQWLGPRASAIVHADLCREIRTAWDFAKAIGCAPERIAKTLFLHADLFTTRANPNLRFVAVVLSLPDRIDLSAVAKKFGAKSMKLARQEQLREVLGTVPGAVSPFSLGSTPLYVDEKLLKMTTVFVNDGTVGIDIEILPIDLVEITRAQVGSYSPSSVRVAIVALILIAAILANVIANLRFPALLDTVPVIGLAVWVVILFAAPLRKPDWTIMAETFKGTIFLLVLVTSASMMPVETLPVASWQTTLGLGFVSAVFDNIPLTALALKQGGYDWGYLAYAVGFGGSMIWFGSSAGVALANMYPEAKSVGQWLRQGWHVAVAYVVGFLFMLAILGWHPDADHRNRSSVPASTTADIDQSGAN